jgi:protein ImuB
MYACLHMPAANACSEELLYLALEFSPAVEKTSNDTVVFSIAPLRKLIGSPHQIASEICRSGYERSLKADLAIASNPDTAILLARNFAGVILVTPGEERFKLGPLPLKCLFMHDSSIDPELLNVLNRWGLKTCEDLAALPERGIAERLGQAAIYLQNLARGKINRPLRISAVETNYQERMDLEHSICLLEPLLFLLGRVLSELCGRLRSQSRAARALEARFELEESKEYRCELEFPVPLLESPAMLKLLQLHLERHLPNAPIVAFTLRVEPVGPRRVQHGLFLPPTPAADKLQVTLARIEGMVGKENVGTPMLLNTYRPDGFQMTALNTSSIQNGQKTISIETQATQQQMLRLAIRLFRPALQARVRVAGITPKSVVAQGVKGKVIQSAGPWKTSGEWWTPTSWVYEEWDVALDDGALYRIYRESQNHEWYVHGIYD